MWYHEKINVITIIIDINLKNHIMPIMSNNNIIMVKKISPAKIHLLIILLLKFEGNEVENYEIQILHL